MADNETIPAPASDPAPVPASMPGDRRRGPDEIARRRTFAIISHPDAGKTTLTEKLLLFGGAIQLAGQVKAKKDKRATRSDWMAIEKARGISVATSVMTFEYGGAVFNLLDTPGHEDFSDHTYRTLTAVDSAIMVIDGARGIEARTLKLFEICRLRDIPIITFVNKMDREAREPLDILDEIEKTLALETAPMVWPIGRGRDFRGTFDLTSPRIRQIDQGDEGTPVSGPDDPAIAALMEADEAARWREEIDLVAAACNPFDLDSFRNGSLTPVFFGSALRNFGVRDLLDALIAHAPPPRAQQAATRTVVADEPAMTGLVFKIQANMDPNHRDRIAFMRICSGKLTRGMRVKVVRSGKHDRARRAAVLLRPGPLAGRGGLRRRHRRHSQQGRSAHRRCRHRGRGPDVRRHPELRARDPAPRAPRRRHPRQEAEGGTARDGRGGRRATVHAARRHAARSSASSARCNSTCSATA